MKKRQFKLMGGAIHLLAAICFASVSNIPAHAFSGIVPDSHSHLHSPDSLIFEGDTLTLKESIVSAKFSEVGKSPLRLTTIDQSLIKQRAVAKSYPEMLKNIPGLYATSETGSFGDAKVNIRGFKQENISVLLNGIPISGQTSGNMFWSNWMGLADATYAVQVQKGVGSSMLSDNSVGGTINILTTPVGEEFSVDAGAYATHYGAFKGYVSVNSGTLPKGWNVSLMASYLGGKGYIDRTDVSTLSYMLNVSKVFKRRHALVFTALGSPETHEQRSSKLSYQEIQQYGIRYNKNWGWLNGQAYNLSKNKYFKPYFTLQHKFSQGKWSMQNSLYLALANGGGRWTESKGPRMNTLINVEGLVDFDRMLAANAGGESQFILSDFMAGHTQMGAIVSAGYRFNKKWRLDFGAHYQHYATWEKEKITDLLGGRYWVDRQPQVGEVRKGVGDYIRTDNGKVTDHFTLYAQTRYQSEKWNVNLGVSGIAATHRRWDEFNYTGDQVWSDRASGTGFSAKGGVLYKPHKRHSVYLNAGAYSRPPYAGVYFSAGNNEITRSPENEKNLLAEIGYRYVYDRGGAEVTGYYAYWMNKTMMSNPYRPVDGEDQRFMVSGLDAQHFGLEINLFHRITRWMKLSAFASLGNWKWQNDVLANIYDEYTGELVQKVDVRCKGLFVGDSPQTQVGAALDVDLPKAFHISVDWNYNDRLFADFDPAQCKENVQSYRIPGYHLLNAHASWNGRLGRQSSLTVFADGNNLLNTMYIERGKDGRGHDLDSFRGYWGFGTHFSFGVRFNFTSLR